MDGSGQVNAALEARTQELGRELLRAVTREQARMATLNRWTKQVLAWCLSDPQLKANVLRFVDCLPVLRDPRTVLQHLREYLTPRQRRLPAALRFGLSLAQPGLITAPAASRILHQMMEQIARQFIAATGTGEAVEVIRRLAAQGAWISLDVLGEEVISDQEADAYAARYAELIRALPPGSRLGLPPGRPSRHLSLKPSSLAARFDPIGFEASRERVLQRLRPLAALAADYGVALTLDMEHYERRDLTLELAKALLSDAELGGRLHLGVVAQAYLRDTDAAVDDLIAWLRARQRRLSVRLVKGAYWDYEVARARQQGWPPPVYGEKRQTDLAFERLTERLMASSDVIRLEVGSHNVRSVARAMALMEARGAPADAVEFQVLYGMGDALQRALSAQGYPVRVYAPVGALIPGMAYLVRRLLENTANESFLRQEIFEHQHEEQLLAPPAMSSS